MDTISELSFWRVMEVGPIITTHSPVCIALTDLSKQQSSLRSIRDLIADIDTSAHLHLSDPEFVNKLEQTAGRTDVQRIMSRMARIISAEPSDEKLAIIVQSWETDKNNPTDFNHWLDENDKSQQKVDQGKECKDLTDTQKIYYGIFLQLNRGENLVS